MKTTPERHREILSHLHRCRRATVSELSALSRVSEATIRRDLDALERGGRLVRAHGAALLPSPLGGEASYSTRSRRAAAAKRAIAARARSFCRDGAQVFVDAGTTTLELGRLLLDAEAIAITTSSLTLANLAVQAGRSITLIGGTTRPVSQALVGTIALTWISHLRFDLAFLGATGLDREGLSTMELREAEVKAAVVARSARVVLLADAGKWDKPAPVRFSGWELVDDWVVDAWTPSNGARPKGVRLHAANPSKK